MKNSEAFLLLNNECYNLSMATGILLDTNVLIALTTNNTEQQTEAEEQLRVASLTCDEFLITGVTLSELNNYFNVRRNVLDKSDYRDLKIFMGSKRVRTLDTRKFINNQELLLKKSEEIERARNYPRDYSNARHVANLIDAVLLVASESMQIPILTLDKAIKAVVPKPLFSWEAPLPFDLEALKKVPFVELMDMSQPLRDVYNRTFQKYKVQVEETKENIRNAKKSHELATKYMHKFRQKEATINELKEELLEKTISEKFWRDAAKPDASSAILWTVIELGVGFLPIAIPTSPITYFIDVMKYKNKLKKYDEQMYSKPLDFSGE